MKLRNLKLKHQLILLIIISIFMMVLVQAIYYVSVNSIIRDRAEIYASNTINQAHESLNLTATNIKKAAYSAAYNTTVQDYLSAGDLAQKNENQKHAANLLKSITDSNPFISDIALVDNNENLFTAYLQFGYDTYYQLKTKYNMAKIDTAFYTPVMRSGSDQTSSQFFCYVYPIFNISSQGDGSKMLGWCIVLCRLQYLQTIVQNTSITPGSLFMLVDNNDTVVVSNKAGLSGKAVSDVVKESAGWDGDTEKDVRLVYNGSLSMIKVKQNQDMGWRTISITPINELTDDLQSVRAAGFIICAVMVLLLGLVGFLFSRSITRPIARLVESMGEIGQMQLKQRIECGETNEIGVIANDINQMLDKLENVTDSLLGMQKKLYVAELSKRETALSALQSQINPHFLYNTLECIQSIGLVYDIPDISNIALAMAKIFRYSIKGGNFTTIREEIECIRDYLSIMTIRFEGKFITEIHVDEALMGIQTVKMILQPIVENAIYHGLEPKDMPGRLTIAGAFTGDRISFEISDDGIGMSTEEMERINASIQNGEREAGLADTSQRSIGLNNINSRIQLYYGKEYGIRLYSKANEGTTVIVELPTDARLPAVGSA